MGRQKRDGNHSPPKNNLIQDSEEIKKMDTQVLTPTKQTETMPRKQKRSTGTLSKKKSCK
jgi:hypothetical protein